jgi:hypothetical protein
MDRRERSGMRVIDDVEPLTSAGHFSRSRQGPIHLDKHLMKS